MRAIILAAGASRRMGTLTVDRPKCLLPLAGRTLLDRQIAALRAAQITDVTIVTGYLADSIAALAYPTRHNPRFADTNMVTSLMCAADRLDGNDDVLITYGDIIYEPRVARVMVGCHWPLATAVDRQWLRLWKLRSEDPLADAETLRLGEDGRITELGKRPSMLEEIQGQYMGLTRVGASLAPELVSFYRGLGAHELPDGRTLDNMYMTDFLQALIDHGHRLQAVSVDGGWLEVDSGKDLALYERLYATGALQPLCDLDGTQ